VACTGVHGANRLASNSLLEGVVFGARAGSALRDSRRSPAAQGQPRVRVEYPNVSEATVREITWEHCGVVRSGEGLRAAVEQLEAVRFRSDIRASRPEYELRNVHTVALLIARCALAREESRGAHFRTDFPESRDEFQQHSYVRASEAVRFA
jgi:L-aspartate oxidase